MKTLKTIWLDPLDYGASLKQEYNIKTTKRRIRWPSVQPNTALILYKKPTEFWGWHDRLFELNACRTTSEVFESALTELDLVDPKVQSMLLRGFSPTDWYTAGVRSPRDVGSSAWAPYIRLVDEPRGLTMFIEPWDDDQILEKSDNQTAEKIGD